MNDHDSLVSHALNNIKEYAITNNPQDPLTAHNLKHFAAIAALNGIISHEGAPAKDNLAYNDVVMNDAQRAIDYADKLVELLHVEQEVSER